MFFIEFTGFDNTGQKAKFELFTNVVYPDSSVERECAGTLVLPVSQAMWLVGMLKLAEHFTSGASKVEVNGVQYVLGREDGDPPEEEGSYLATPSEIAEIYFPLWEKVAKKEE